MFAIISKSTGKVIGNSSERKNDDFHLSIEVPSEKQIGTAFDFDTKQFTTSDLKKQLISDKINSIKINREALIELGKIETETLTVFTDNKTVFRLVAKKVAIVGTKKTTFFKNEKTGNQVKLTLAELTEILLLIDNYINSLFERSEKRIKELKNLKSLEDIQEFDTSL